MRNRFRYVNDMVRKSQLCETFQRRVMPLNRKARINMTMGFNMRLIARGETREEICTFRQRAINDRKCSGPDTFERRFSPDHFRPEARGESWSGLVSIFSESANSAGPCSIRVRRTLQRRYGRENIGPRERLTRFRILKTISPVFFSCNFHDSPLIRLTKLHFPTELDEEISVLDSVLV